jgi:hypothetical protein
MDAIEKFRETVTNAISVATAAGAEQGQLHRLLLEFIGVDPAAARDAAENLAGLIDGEDDDLAEQLVPAQAILRRIAGS